MSRLTFIDFFTGIGGFRLGLEFIFVCFPVYLYFVDNAYWKFGFDYGILEAAYNKCWKEIYGNGKG